jgi:cation diffusion facilitator CzcD-associated flavoprotein CzcO
LPILEETGYIPKDKYVTSKEIRDYLSLIVKIFSLRPKTHFQTEVNSMTWDDSSHLWTVKTSQEDVFTARFVVTGTGAIHKPKLPGVAGIDTFKGNSFHTSRWDYDYTGGYGTDELSKLSDKRVGLIGTGATSIQVVPAVAKYAKEFYVFQRTPATVGVRGNRPTDDAFKASLTPGWQKARMENFNAMLAGVPVTEDLVNDGWTNMKVMKLLGSDEGGDAAAMDPERVAELMAIADFQGQEAMRARVDEVVKDSKTAESLKPWYASFCKRPCFHDEYLQSFNKPNVHLVDTDGRGVQAVTETGIKANDVEYPLDLIIYASGFEVTTSFERRSGIKTYGRGGRSLADKYSTGGFSTFHGLTTRDFPNFFNIGASQVGVSINYSYTIQKSADHIAYIIASCNNKGVTSVEPTQEAEEEWVRTVVEGSEKLMSYFANCTPSYNNNEGTLRKGDPTRATYGDGASAWAQLLSDWREKGDFAGLEMKAA